MNATMKKIFSLLVIMSVGITVLAWGDAHRWITKAACEVQPEKTRLIAYFGEQGYQDMGYGEADGYCLIPDVHERYTKMKSGHFFGYDYLLQRGYTPFYVHHGTRNNSTDDFYPNITMLAQRTLQAFRTETPVEAARRLGCLLHFIEDAGAPCHAAEIGVPVHTAIDNWVNPGKVGIPDYKPKLLGKDDESAIKSLLDEVSELTVLSIPIGLAQNLVLKDNKRMQGDQGYLRQSLNTDNDPDRAKIEEMSVPATQKSAKVAADAIYTLTTLGLAPTKNRAGLAGSIKWASSSQYAENPATIVLLDAAKFSGQDSSLEKMYDACTIYSTHSDEKGSFSFHNLPAGDYRAAFYRPGSKMEVSQPFALEDGVTKKIDITLVASQTPDNIVWNGELTLCTYQRGLPDRWARIMADKGINTYFSAPIPLMAKTAYSFGAKIMDPNTKVTFYVLEMKYQGLFNKVIVYTPFSRTGMNTPSGALSQYIAGAKEDYDENSNVRNVKSALEKLEGEKLPLTQVMPSGKIEAGASLRFGLFIVESGKNLNESVMEFWVTPSAVK